ncbi:MAG: hypothetical protein HN396_04535 [Gemmatimonadales bacterium]|jgi:hypothetical protein|nr:hypothetical protein [Gemmatimonadales bacterium]
MAVRNVIHGSVRATSGHMFEDVYAEITDAGVMITGERPTIPHQPNPVAMFLPMKDVAYVATTGAIETWGLDTEFPYPQIPRMPGRG